MIKSKFLFRNIEIYTTKNLKWKENKKSDAFLMHKNWYKSNFYICYNDKRLFFKKKIFYFKFNKKNKN